jgi:hypothetical protein
LATVLTVASLGAPVAATAQQADVIRGLVTSTSGGAPIANASVVATSPSRGVNRAAKTDRDGRYTITFPGGEGDYFLTITAIGYTPRRFELRRSADEDILIGDAQLAPASAALDTVVTVGKRSRPASDNGAPDVGGADRPVNMGLVPAEQLGSLASMAASTPGVLFVQGVDGDPSGYSLLGLDGSQNGLTINGMNSGAADLPRDADVAVTLAMSPYDVSQGQFSGGRLNVRLPSGSNFTSRASSLRLNAPPLEWTDAAGRALGQRYTDANLGGVMAGPISLDQAFYNFSYQLGRRGNDLETLLNTNPLGLETEGIAADSVARLLNLLRGAGVPPTVDRFPSHRLADQGLVLGGFDYTPLSSASGQAFNLTMNGSWNRVAPASAVATALPSSAFDLTAWNGAIQFHHSAFFGFGILSESGASLSSSRRYSAPYLDLPNGTVLVGSSFTDRPSGVQPIAFGGTGVSNSATTQSLDLTNQLSWFSLNNKHRLKLTSELRADAIASVQSIDGGGAFAFNSLSELESGQASSFVRQLTAATTHEHELIGALSLGDSYRPSPELQIVYGARVDADRFLDRPDVDPDLVAQFGVHNERLPTGIYASPRIGFSWVYGAIPQIAPFEGAARPPRAVLSGGIGDFRNSLNISLPGQALATTGLPGGVQQLTCVGAAAPVPDWSAYAADPGSVPSVCADGTAGNVFANATPNATLLAPGYAAQHSVRSTLKWLGAVLDNRFVAAVSGTYSLNLNQTGFVDLNLDPTPQFTLPDEAGRPVFVDPTSIVPGTGAIAAHDDRRSPQFNHVTELRSDLSSVSRQLTVQLSPLASSTRYTWGLSYTLNSVRDRENGFTSTTGNPFAIDAARSAFDWRHQILFDVGYNLFDAVRLFWVQSFFSGLPITPIVAGDVNGDGYNQNDRAFVFDPARTADTALAASMRSLLELAPRGIRDCLGRQLNQLASRSSCEGPWSSAASLRIDFNPAKIRMPQRTSISFSVANPLAAADLLFHGENRLHGWGQNAVPDDRLLFVRGFDPQAKQFSYQVNQRFGGTSQAVSAARIPVTLTALVRVDLGPSREKQTLTRTLDLGRSTPGVKATAPEIKGSFGTAGLINPMAAMLRASDLLHLTGRQADSLATMNRWYVVRLDSIWSPLAKQYAALPESYDHGAAYGRYVRAREASVDLLMRLTPSINTLMTPEQIRKLPDLVRAFLDRRYLAAVRAGTQGLSGPVFPTGVGVPSTGGAGRGRGGGPGGGR